MAKQGAVRGLTEKERGREIYSGIGGPANGKQVREAALPGSSYPKRQGMSWAHRVWARDYLTYSTVPYCALGGLQKPPLCKLREGES